MTSARRLVVRWYPVLLALAGAALSLAVYPRLPASMVTHWDAQGHPNGWMPRQVGAFFAPVLLLGIAALLRGVPHIDPRRANYERFDDAYETVVAAVLVLILATHGVTIAAALGARVPVARVVPALVGALFVVIGNVMPRLRSNWWFGIRTPWTLSSDRVWARTHRLGGYAMAGAGIVMLLAALVLPASLGLPVILGCVVASVIAPVVYSYLTWRREQRG